MAKSYAGRKASLAPYGNAKPLGAKGIARVSRGGKSGRGRSSPALSGMPSGGTGLPANSPANWWIVGSKRASPTAPTNANATRHNGIVSRAFAKAGYA